MITCAGTARGLEVCKNRKARKVHELDISLSRPNDLRPDPRHISRTRSARFVASAPTSSTDSTVGPYRS